MSLALLFPGQGSQHVGMTRDLVDYDERAAALIDEADSVLGFPLSRLMWEGPEEKLTRTENAQPALLVHSAAVLATLSDRLGPFTIAAGHSLGEFSAHLAAGTFSFGEAVEVVRLRGELMAAAGQARPGTMAAILGLSDSIVRELCEKVDEGLCVPANYNTEGQVVVSGDLPGVSALIERAREAGAKRAMQLKVSGAFHSPLMQPAVVGLATRLKTMEFRDPVVPVVSNVTTLEVTSGEEARSLLIRQLTSPVSWSASITTIVGSGADRFLELGPGSVLCGLNRRIARDLPCVAVGTAEGIEAYLSAGKEP